MGRAKATSNGKRFGYIPPVGKQLTTSLEEILETRGYKKEQLLAEKNPTLKWENLTKGIELLKDYLLEHTRYGVLYDVDVDGTCAGYITEDYLRSRGLLVKRYMNTRKLHGLNQMVLDWVEEEQLDVLFVVDAGTNDIKWHRLLSDAGVKVIILDHHEQKEKEVIPNVHLINCSVDEGGNLPKLSGAGVCYRFFEAFDKEIRGGGIRKYEHWVGLTVLSDQCSMLDKENRYYVETLYKSIPEVDLYKAFKFYGSRRNLFVYGVIPYLNACIRLNETEIAMESLWIHGETHVRNYVETNRKTLLEKQSNLLEDLKAAANIQKGKHVQLVFLRDDHIKYSGLTGLLGNRMMYEDDLPTIVLYKDMESNLYRGSLRGQENIMSNEILTGLGWTVKGHSLAAGIELSIPDAPPLFAKALEYEPERIQTKLKYDVRMKDTDILMNMPILEEMARFNEYASGDIETLKVCVDVTGHPQKEVDSAKRATYYFSGMLKISDFEVERKNDTTEWVCELSFGKKNMKRSDSDIEVTLLRV